MWGIAQQIIFGLAAAAAIFLFWRSISRLRRNIFLGRKFQLGDRRGPRWRRMILNALGQRKMFKRPIPAILHFFVYVGFIIINVEIIEIGIDGLIGGHRTFAPFLGSAYPFIITFLEFLAVGVLLSVLIFLWRRNIQKVPRLSRRELSSGWPKLDANIILWTEVVLMSAFLTLNSVDQILIARQGAETLAGGQSYFFSGFLIPLFDGLSTASLRGVERGAWWLHILGIFAFLNYLPYSKHLHILLAFPNSWYSRQSKQGTMPNMPVIENEVKLMLDPSLPPPADAPAEKFGAKDVTDLQWRDLLAAYSCTECGRCTAVCPASITGKKLSPRKIMMDTRDRLEEIGDLLDKNKSPEDGKALLGDYISTEELMACTTCQACVEACPVNISPLAIIHSLRRYTMMEDANMPAPWNAMVGNLETNATPWQFNPQDRANWAAEIS